MALGPYASFIVTSYALVAAVVLILIVWIAHRLSPPEGAPARTRGQRRRSGAPAAARRISDERARHIGRTPAGRRWLVALPLIGFIALAGLFLLRLHGGDPSKIPSALIGRPAPQTALPALEGLVNNGAPVPGLDPAAFKGKVSVVNVWASWCVPCHDEAPLLTALAKDKRLQIVGINYKDSPDNARRFLGRYGNPFGMVGVDGNGRASIEWGVYGVPETFVVGREGTILYKMVGPVTPANIDSVLKAEIEKALKRGRTPSFRGARSASPESILRVSWIPGLRKTHPGMTGK